MHSPPKIQMICNNEIYGYILKPLRMIHLHYVPEIIVCNHTKCKTMSTILEGKLIH